MGQLDDAIEADRRQAEWALAEAERQRVAAAAEVRRMESLAAPLVAEFIQRAISLNIEPDYEITTAVRLTQEHVPRTGYMGPLSYNTYTLREKVVDATLIDCWNLAPEGSGSSYYLSQEGFHIVRQAEESPRRKVPFSNRLRSHLTVNWVGTPPSIKDIVYTESKRDEYYNRYELKQAMVLFFNRHPR